VGDFSTPLSQIIGHSHKKIKKETLELNGTTDQKDLSNIYRVFHTATAQDTFFSVAYGTFSKTDHIIGHKASLHKFLKN
jgi:hypothetical protein